MFHVSNKKPPWVFFNPSIHYPILKSYSLHGWRFSAIFRIGEIICEIPEISGGWSKQRDAAAARPLPLVLSAAAGCRLTDVDGNSYIDYTLAWGPLILTRASRDCGGGTDADCEGHPLRRKS